MQRRGQVIGISLLFTLSLCVTPVFSQQKSAKPPFITSIELNSGLTLPIGVSAEQYSLGSSNDVIITHSLRNTPMVNLEVLVGYNILPLKVLTSLSLFNFGVGVGIHYYPFYRFSIEAAIEGGYYIGFMNSDPSTAGGSFFLTERVGVAYRIIPKLRAGVQFAFRNYFGLYTDFRFSLVVGFHPKQEKVNTLEVPSIETEPVYPELYRYYLTHPVGKMQLNNLGTAPLERLNITDRKSTRLNSSHYS